MATAPLAPAAPRAAPGRLPRRAGQRLSAADRRRRLGTWGWAPLAAGRSMLVSAVVHAGALLGLALAVVDLPDGPDNSPLRTVLREAPPPERLETLLPLVTNAATEAQGHGGAATASFASPFAAGGTSGIPAAAPQLAEAGLPPSGIGGSLLDGLEEGLRKAAGESGGDTATFFGISVSGERVVYVVDYSASMEGGRFRRARGELRRSLRELRPTQQFYVVFFNTAAWKMPADDLQDATKDNLLAARKWIDDVKCVGDTDPLPALEVALDLNADAIFFLTDGKFDPAVVDRIPQAESRGGTPIHTIGFMNRAGEDLLQEIARRTGGTYKFVP